MALQKSLVLAFELPDPHKLLLMDPQYPLILIFKLTLLISTLPRICSIHQPSPEDSQHSLVPRKVTRLNEKQLSRLPGLHELTILIGTLS